MLDFYGIQGDVPKIATIFFRRSDAMIDNTHRQGGARTSLFAPISQLYVSIVVALIALSLAGCSSLEDRISRQTLYLYQVQPAAGRASDKSTPAGIRSPVDLDSYTIPLCPPTMPSVDTLKSPDALKNVCPGENAYIAAISDPSGAIRNRLKAVLVTRSDLICSQTEAQIVGTNDLINFTLTETTTVLGGAGALVTGLTAAKILSGLAAMSNATRSNVNAVFYENAVKAAIIQKINDIRAAKLASINTLSMSNGSAVPLNKYSTEEMLGDLEAYHDMCSFYAGVNGLTSTTIKPPTGGGDSKPPAPTIKSVSSKDGNISVTWDAQTDSSVVIISYTATATNADVSKKEKPLVAATTGTQTSVDIPHCTADESYTVAVVGTNGAGDGAASKPSSAIKCVAPAVSTPSPGVQFPPPTNVSASSSGNSLNVSLKSPAAPKSPVLTYSVTATNVDASAKEKPIAGKSTAPATMIVVPGCVTGHLYRIVVIANYATGSSKSAAAPTSTKCAN
jgi:hypothetical protein